MPLQIKESKFQIQSHKCRYLKHYFMGSTRSIHGSKPFGSSPVARNVKLTTYSLKCLFGFLIIFVISGSRCVTVACGGWGWGASLLFVENAYSEFNNSFGKPFVVLRCFIWGWAGNQTRTLSDSFDFPGPKGGSEAAVECLNTCESGSNYEYFRAEGHKFRSEVYSECQYLSERSYNRPVYDQYCHKSLFNRTL